MAFLALVPVNAGQTDPSQLQSAARDAAVHWFDPRDRSRGGAVCLSSLATTARVEKGDGEACLIVGRVRLDRREELQAVLFAGEARHCTQPTDADLCLKAYIRWGERFVEHIHGDFSFILYDGARRELLCVRDRFGVRLIVWSQRGSACWIAGSMDAIAAATANGPEDLDSAWIADFLRSGFCDDPSRSVFSNISRLPPGHLLSIGRQGAIQKRYWTLEVAGPLHLKSQSDYIEEFHDRLNLAMRDRLPSDRLGLMLSGGLDSSTLAAKALELGESGLKVSTRTWLVGGEADPEAKASSCVAKFLGLEQTFVDADRLRLDPCWRSKPTAPVEPSLEVLKPLDCLADTQAMRDQAACWFYGEGPDNALTFEWQMHLQWMVRHRQWSRLPGAIIDYLATKSAADWITSFQTRLGLGHHQGPGDMVPELDWVRGQGTMFSGTSPCNWRPMAHSGFSSPLWSMMFEGLDADGDRFGIDWRHPYMDLRVVEFLLACPPIPWARRKLLIRRAMRDRLPDETLRRPKVPLYKDDLGELLQFHLHGLPKAGEAIEEFVDLARLPDEPRTHPDIYALTRITILQHWLAVHFG